MSGRSRAAWAAVIAGVLVGCGESGIVDPGSSSETGEWTGIGGPGSFAVVNETCRTIDFEGFTEDGALVTTVPSGFGFDLSVTVELDAAQAVQSLPEARVFDTDAVTPTNDPDMRVSQDCPDCDGLGMVLIIESKEGFPPFPSGGEVTPDDSRTGGRIVFAGFAGQGDFVLKGFKAIDNDAEEPVFFARVDDSLDLEPTSTQQGNGSVEEILITTPHTFETELSIQYERSGATDDIEICRLGEIVRGGEGCTPGYWKQPQHADSWNGISPETLFGDVFTSCEDVDLRRPESGDLCAVTLLEALGLRGGGVNALARHAAAAYLNANLVDYYWLESEVLDNVNDVFDGQENAQVVHGWLEDANESWCPLD